MRIALDIDDVLFPWSDLAHAACELAGITNGQQITQWEFYRDYGCTADDLWSVLYDAYGRGMLLGEPYADTVEQLQRLRNLGHSIHLVTARGFESGIAAAVRAATAEWLEVHNVPHDTLTFARDKSVVLAHAALDDSIANCNTLATSGAATWLMTRPHNAAAESSHPRVASLTEFVDLVEAAA